MQYQFTYDINIDDYLAFNRFCLSDPTTKRNALRMRILLPVALLVISLLLVYAASLEGGLGDWNYLLSAVGLLGALIYAIFQQRFADFSLKRRLEKMRADGSLYCDAKVSFEFSNRNCKLIRTGSESSIPYSSFTHVEEDDGTCYLFTEPQSAHILPARVFASDSDREEFISFIQEKRQSHTKERKAGRSKTGK